jgi:hypothetical protein
VDAGVDGNLKIENKIIISICGLSVMPRLPTMANACLGTTTRPGERDRRHVKGRETPYRFVDLDELQADFWTEVDEWSPPLRP